MYVLALNCGSSSLKYQVYDIEANNIIAKGLVEKIGLNESFFTHTNNGVKAKEVIAGGFENHQVALKKVIENIKSVVPNINDIKAVGHRVAHGGEKFTCSVEITKEVEDTIRDLSFLAPVHNPANLTGIMAAKEVLPEAKQVAVFDTAFHQTVPDYIYRYAVPATWYKDLAVRRYGFHGTSILYVSKRAADMLGKDPKDVNLIVLHVGSGASACAIKNGESYDISTGMTPVEGLIMGTRPGDLDAGVPLAVMQKYNMSANDMFKELNNKSGVLGITECYADRRDVENNRETDDKCRLAMEMEAYRLKKYIGSYYASLDGKVDAVVWTAGSGENGALNRQMTMKGLENLGMQLDAEKNIAACAFTGCGEQVISKDKSPVKILMIPTNEEIVMIEDTIAILKGTYEKDHLKMKYSFAPKQKDR